MFIVIDGVDGSGKRTQSEMLIELLKKTGRPVEIISFPQYGAKSAGPVEDYLNGLYGTAAEVGPYRASALFAVDRFAASSKIKTWLKEDKIIIADRYVSSNMGHQGSSFRTAEERKKFFAWDDDLEYRIFEMPRPDLNIILHVPAKIAQQLVDKKAARNYLAGAKRDILEADLQHLKNAEDTYLQMAMMFPNFVVVECVENEQMLPMETIQEKIWQIVQSKLK